MDPLALLPELAVLIGALVALVGGSFLPRGRQWLARAAAVAALLVSAAATSAVLADQARSVYGQSFTIDRGTNAARLVVVLATLLVIALGTDELRGSPRESETYALLLLSSTGVMVLAGASDLLVLAVGFLLASIPVYGLIGLARTRAASEAAMKTYLLGALFGILLLLGVTVLYGVATGTTYDVLGQRLGAAPLAAVVAGAVAVLAGLAFEAGAVPAHMWVPDAAQGSSVTAAAYLTTVPKVGALVAVYRFVQLLPDPLDWRLLVGVLAVASMTLGNLAALGQDDVRRLLGWSTVSQVGYLLGVVAVAGRSSLALPALLLYLAAYSVTNLAAFAVVGALPEHRDLATYRGLARSQPWLAVSLAVALLGLLGTPPTSVFVGKLAVASAMWGGGQVWLAVALVVNTLISLGYYLRWIAPAFATTPDSPGAPPAFAVARTASSAAVVAAVVSVALGIGAGQLLDLFGSR